MKYEIKNFELRPDFHVEVKDGGVRPLAATAEVAFPSRYGGDRATIVLSQARLEKLLDCFQELVGQQIVANMTRADDQLIGGVDVVEPTPTDPVALLRELVDIEGPCPGTATWAKKVDAFLASQNSEGSAE